MNQPAKKQAVETLIDEFKLALKGPRQDGADKDPTLRVGIFENNPRFRVKTNVHNDANNGYIDAAMDSRIFFQVTEAVRQIANDPNPCVYMMDNLGHPWIQGQRSKDKKPMSRMKIEKDANGVISMEISAGNRRPMIPFVFHEHEYHFWKDGQGQPMPLALASKLGALGWVKMWEEFITEALAITYAKPEWMTRNDNGGGGGGGYQQRPQGGGGGQQYGGGQQQRPQQGGGGYQQSAPAQGGNDNFSFDDDIPL